MTDSLRSAGVDRYDDLHIDRIDEQWRNRAVWIQASLEALKLADSIKAPDSYSVSVVLAFSLHASETKRGIDFNNLEELAERLNQTPPSLYLFRHGAEPWVQESGKHAITARIDGAIFKPFSQPKDCFYMEFKTPYGNEYYRTVFVKA